MNTNAMPAKPLNRFGSLSAIALILVGVIVLNAVATFALVGWRFDFTSEGLYSFSPGTRAILRSLKDPVRLDLYASRESTADIPELRAHAQRVQEYLGELASLSNGKLELRVIHPQPFSEEEDTARIAGLVVQPVNNAGGTAILGLVVTGPGLREKVISVFAPDRDSFIEYEVVKAIATVGRAVKPKVGLLSCIPLQPARMLPDGSMGGPSPVPFVIEQMRELFDMVEVADNAAQLPVGIDALLLVQPRKLPESMLKSIDAWAVAGKPLVVLADPFAETDQHPDSRAMGAKVSATTYDFPLLRAWGVDIPPDMTVGDMNFTTRIQTPGPGNTMRELNYVAWLSLTRAALNQSDPLMNRFEAINFKSVGEIQKLKDRPEGVAPNIEPLIFSSDKSQLIQSLKLGYFGDAEQLLRDLKPDGVRRVFAAWITGPIGSLFTPAIGNANIVLIADADLLANETWVNVDPQTGIPQAFSDNGPLIIGLLERMAGDPAVATLRSRGGFRRPFEIVQELRKAAEAKYIAREKDLQLEVRETEMNIAQLQEKVTGGETGPGKLSPEQQAELAQLQIKVNAYRKELRGVQYGLRQEVDALGQRLLILNVVLWPVIVAIAAGLWCWRAARRVDHSRSQGS